MPKGKPREGNRKDIWLTDRDSIHIQQVMALMHERGIPPLREGRYSLSQVVRFILEEFVKDL